MPGVDAAVRVKAEATLLCGHAGASWLGLVARTSTATDGSLQTFDWDASPVQALAWSPDGDTAIAVDAAGRLGVWRLLGHQQILLTPFSDASASVVCTTRDGLHALIGSQDGVVRAIDLRDRSEAFMIRAHTQAVTAIVVMHDNIHAASVSTDGSIAVWKLPDESPPRSTASSSTSPTQLVAVWTPADGSPRKLHGAARAAAPGLLLAAASDGQLEIWDLKSGSRVRLVAAEVGALSAVLPIPGARDVLVVGATGVARVDPDTGSARPQAGELGAVGKGVSLALHPIRGSKPANYYALVVRELSTGAVVMRLSGHTEEITALAAHPDPARVVSASFDRELRLWNTGDGTSTSFSLAGCMPRSVAVHPDGDRVLIGGTILSMWSLSQRRPLGSFGEPGAWIETVMCSPSGELALTVGRDRSAFVWDLRTGELAARWDGEHPFAVGAFGPRGRVILGDDVGMMTFLELVRGPPPAPRIITPVRA